MGFYDEAMGVCNGHDSVLRGKRIGAVVIFPAEWGARELPRVSQAYDNLGFPEMEVSKMVGL